MSFQTNFEKIIERFGGIEPSVGDEFNPLTTNDIDEIERAVGARLGKTLHSLRSIWLTYGSFRFTNYAYYAPATRFPKTYSTTNRGIVGTFLGRMHPKYPRARAISVAHRIELLRPELPPKFLPIADNGAGDLVCVSLSARDVGKVYLWNHEGAEGDDCYFVSSHFDEWIMSLTTK